MNKSIAFLLACALVVGVVATAQEKEPEGTAPAGGADVKKAENKAPSAAGAAGTEKPGEKKPPDTKAGTGGMVEPKQGGGESAGIVQVANLVYAGTKTSKCFSDHFLVQAEKASSISTSRRFHAVKLSSDELFEFPLVIMTGEGPFMLADGERQNLRRYIERGGFLLASAGCSSPDWDRAFRSEMARVFTEHPLASIPMDHPVFHTVYDIKDLQGSHGKVRLLEGISIGGRLGILYSQDGLNDTSHTHGCCCCGGNEITNCIQVNVNVLAYALTY